MFLCYFVYLRKQLVDLSTYYVTLSFLASNLFTCLLVDLSTFYVF